MQTVYQDDYTAVAIHQDQQLVTFFYKPERAAHMQEADFKRAMSAYGQMANFYQPSKLLVDSSQGQFVIVPNLQEWVAKEVAPLTTSLKQMAFVLSKDIFAQVAFQQMMEEKEIADHYDAPRYFDEREKALAWLGVAL
jgi:hypothetical protein